jgi:ribonuclease J
MNCLLYEWNDEAVMVDCGVMFHDEDLGIDIVHPAFDYLLGSPGKLKAVILTHGHEDHIGAVPFLLQHFNVPIYASPLVHELVGAKLKELPVPWKVESRPVRDGSAVEIGPLRIEFAGVNHSIPQAMSLFIRTPAGNILHTSDFKIGSPDDPDAFRAERFEAFRRQGVDLMLSDSTNVEKAGTSGAESTVMDSLFGIIEQSPSRVFITFFPSNIRRMRALLGLAGRLGRKVVLLGRSMESYLRAAVNTGLIPDEDPPIIPLALAGGEDGANLLFFVSGTQGEPRSAMSKIARGEHGGVRIDRDDVFIYSSRHIPGNEMDISRVMDDIARQGGRIYHIENTPGIHVSGHGHRGELEEMLRLASPSAFIPIHGNYHYLAQHARMAASAGIGDILVIQNGEAAGFDRAGGLSVVDQVPAGKVLMDGLVEVSADILQARRSISEGGVVSAVVVLSGKDGAAARCIKVASHGVLDGERFTAIEHATLEKVGKKLKELARGGKLKQDSIRKEIKKIIEKYYSKHLGRRPYVTVEVIETED